MSTSGDSPSPGCDGFYHYVHLGRSCQYQHPRVGEEVHDLPTGIDAVNATPDSRSTSHAVGLEPDEEFAIEIEFKITNENILAITQARPWVFSGSDTVTEPEGEDTQTPPQPRTPPPPPPPTSRSGGGGGGGGGTSTPPVGVPAFTEGSRASRTVMENTATGVNIGEPVAATDPDDDPITYTLVGSARDGSDMDAASGQLRTKGPLDYETQDTYVVTVGVRDRKADGHFPRPGPRVQPSIVSEFDDRQQAPRFWRSVVMWEGSDPSRQLDYSGFSPDAPTRVLVSR